MHRLEGKMQELIVQNTTVVKSYAEVVGKKAKKNLLPMQSGDVPSTWADISALEKDLGYKPKVDVKEGIKKFVEWYRWFYKV